MSQQQREGGERSRRRGEKRRMGDEIEGVGEGKVRSMGEK